LVNLFWQTTAEVILLVFLAAAFLNFRLNPRRVHRTLFFRFLKKKKKLIHSDRRCQFVLASLSNTCYAVLPFRWQLLPQWKMRQQGNLERNNKGGKQKAIRCSHPANAQGVADGAVGRKKGKDLSKHLSIYVPSEKLKLKLEQHEKRARHACWKNSAKKLPTNQKGVSMYMHIYYI